MVFNEQYSFAVSGLGSLSVPHKHMKYLMEGLIEFGVHNVGVLMVAIQVEKKKVF